MMLKNCDYVGVIIPASFLNADLFLDRLHSYTLLSSKMFTDTENPVCLALFCPQKSNSVYLYENEKYIGELFSIRKQADQILTNNSSSTTITFNNKQGNLGLRAISKFGFDFDLILKKPKMTLILEPFLPKTQKNRIFMKRF